MADYNFDKGNNDFGETIRIDQIHEKVKHYKKEELEHTRQMPGVSRPRESASYREDSDRSQQSRQRKPSGGSGGKGGSSGKEKMPSDKEQFRRLLILAVIIGVIFFVVAFAVTMFQNRGENSQEQPVQEEEPLQTAPVAAEDFQALVLTKESDSRIELYDLQADKSAYYNVTDQTVFENGLSRSRLSAGDLVEVSIAENTTADIASLASIQNAWSKTDTSQVQADTGTKTLKVGGSSYKYKDETLFLYESNRLSPEDIETVDIVTLKGIDDTVWCVEVTKYHGFVVLDNKEAVENGTVQIDNNPAAKLEEIEEIPVQSGAHTLTVKGDNIEDYTISIFVTDGEQFRIDLQNLQGKTAIVVLNVNVDGYSVLVDGQKLESTSPLVLPLGEYTLRIEKEGYLPWEQKVTLTESEASFDITLEEDLKIGSLAITTQPSGAQVFLDNAYIGLSPLTTNIKYGEHQLIVKKEGYKDVSVPFVVDGATIPVNVTMEPEMTEAEEEME